MKRKNGFTLIELLAVIIILGILMIIAIPSVTSYINNSRKSAYVDSAKEIIAGARNFVNEGKVPMYDTSATYYIKSSCISTENGQKSPYGDFVDEETYVIVTYSGIGYDYYWVSRDTTGQGVQTPTALKDLDEDDIKSDIALGTIIPTKISDDKSNVQVINENCNGFDPAGEGGSGDAPSPISYEGKKRDELVVGDTVKIGEEKFYVIDNDTANDKVTLLAYYNLKVGNIYSSSYSKTGEYTSSDTGYGLQSSDVKGHVSGASSFNGTVEFSSTNYWNKKIGSDYPGSYCASSSETNCAYVYDSNSVLYQYVEAYKEYLISKGAPNTIEARLITFEEANAFKNAGKTTELFTTSFWLGSARGTYSLWSIYSSGNFSYDNYSDFDSCGVRPVIVI